MKNRPLCSLCLVIAILIGVLTAGAGAKFVPELRPSPVEQYGEKNDWLIVRGQVYKKEEKEKYQILYLKKCSVYFQKDQQSQQNQQSQQSFIKESRMLIYDEKKNKIQIGNEVEAEGKLSFFETARNPGNFDQKAYYQRQNIHGKVWSETLKITDHTVKRIQNVLENIRVHCRNILLSGREKRQYFKHHTSWRKIPDGPRDKKIISGERNRTYIGNFRFAPVGNRNRNLSVT